MKDAKEIIVWSNGSVIRMYVGQDHRKEFSGWNYKTSKDKGFRKMKCILMELEGAEK